MTPEPIKLKGKIEQLSSTFKIDFENNKIMGKIDELETAKQAVFLMLTTERDYSEIYEGYGLKISDLIGQEIGLVSSELKRRVIDLLKEDDRIVEVDDFKFVEDSDGLEIIFRVISIYGSFVSKGVYKI